uniref:Uncharacterized protein KIAA1211 homolog n=1 Tax=Phallusia mammillata TaxID=59560 RepID=A0A6F9D9R3_9ASCI|nr:uncharacterized protein KIAA1211 homolog [Phallusia mammillata]
MYSLKELRTWWEVPAIAHFFSLFKSCFLLTDFTIEELEDALMTDGEEDKSTIFTSRLLTELLQGCYDNPNISVTTYHDTLIDIMKTRWEDEDGRVNPLSSINADFHSLPTRLKVQIIHRLTEYRLDALDVAEKLAGLNPSDLRLEPLGADRHGSRYWYFFGVRLYKETPWEKVAKKRKREQEKKAGLKRSKSSLSSDKKLERDASLSESDAEVQLYDFSHFFHHHDNHSIHGKKKKLKKKKMKKKKAKEEKLTGFPHNGLSDNLWEVVCYNVHDWNKLSNKLENGSSRREESLRQLIVDNFLPNLPKIVEDMEQQKKHKAQLEYPRRSSCRLLAKKLHEEEDELELSVKGREKLMQLRKERENIRRKEDDARLASDFKVMLDTEIERIHKLRQTEWLKKQEEEKIKRLAEGLPIDSGSSSEESMQPEIPVSQLKGKLMSKNQNKSKTRDKTCQKKSLSNGKTSAAARAKSGKPTKRATKKVPPSRRRASVQSQKSNTEVESSHEEEEMLEDDPNQHLLELATGDAEYKAMKETWELLDTHQDAWPFQAPVEEWYAPKYHKIIKRPMDLSTIETKLDDRIYKKVTEFMADITLMFNNCRLYNGPESEYTQVANELDKLFKSNLFSKLSPNVRESKTKKGKSPHDGKDTNTVTENKTPVKQNGKDTSKVELLDDFDEEEDDEEEQDEESSSSDEFTPPGVSKAQVKKKRLEVAKTLGVIKDKPGTVKSKTPVAIKKSTTGPTRRSSVDVRSNKRKKEDSEEEEEPPPLKTTQRRTSTNRSRGRGSSKTRARRTSVSTRSSIQKTDSESEEESPPVKRRAAPKRTNRGGRGGPPASSKTRPRRSSTQQNKTGITAKTDSSDLAESDDMADGELSEKEELSQKANVTEEVLDNTDALSTDHEKEDEIENDISLDQSGTNDEAAVIPVPNEVEKREDSPLREAESSSSSSRASSRSPSLEKFEKLEEDAKSKPQVLWSLDYLASQARVLEEQHRKLEASTSSSRSEGRKSTEIVRRNSSQPGTPASDLAKLAEENKNPSSSSPAAVRPHGRNTQWNPSPIGASPLMEEGQKARNFGSKPTPGRGDDMDPYSFNDEDSPATLFAKKPDTEGPPSTEMVQNPGPKTDPVAMGPPLSSPRPSPRIIEQQQFPQHPVPPQDRLAEIPKPKPVQQDLHKQTQSAAPRNVPQSPHAKPVERSPVSMPTPPSNKPVPTPPRPMSQDHGMPMVSRVAESPHTQPQPQKLNPEPLPVAAARQGTQDVAATNTSSRSLTALTNIAQRYSEKPDNNRVYPAPPTSNHAPSTVAMQHPSAAVPHVSNGPRSVPQPHPSTPSIRSPRSMYQQSPTPQYSKRPESGEQMQAQHNKVHEKPKQTTQGPRPQQSNPSAPMQRQISEGSRNNMPQQSRGNPYNPQVSQQHAPPSSAHDVARRHPSVTPGQGFESRSQSRSMSDVPYHNQGQPGNTSAAQNPAYNYGGQQQQQQQQQAQVSRRSSVTSAPRAAENDASPYSHQQKVQSSTPPVLLHNPTMASFGLSPWSLAQQANDVQTSQNNGSRQNVPRKNSNVSGGGNGSYPTSKSTAHSGGSNMQPMTSQTMQQHYHTPPSSSSSVPQQHSTASTGSHHSANKHRTQSTEANKPRQNVASNNSAGQSAAGRRQSANSGQQYQKNSTDYMGYHIPPTPAPTPRDARTPVYSPHQQNGLLSAAGAANNNTSLLHQDLTASATLRALQQQHKTDRPAHAAASMLHYAAAAAAQQTQGAVAAANEQYSRLANAHHRATPQHAHPLAGVYHHHQNAATSSAHQAAAHLSSPWLQAAAAAPAAGYPSNLLPPPHMDPVYQLMQQSGMHGQYSMYSNPVMQQLHQQHLQHHMLPKY